MDVSDDSRTPSPKETTPRPEVLKTSSANIDPALGGGASPALSSVSSPREHSESGDSAKDRAEEAWIANIRVVEALRKLISDRLERKDYDEDEEMSGVQTKVEEKSSENLYPVLRADDD